MSFYLVFFLHSRTTGVVSASSVTCGAQAGDVAKVRWEGRSYKAKVLFIGHKELCEMKSSSVTTDGELVEDSLDVSSVSVPAASPRQEISRESTPRQAAEIRELITRVVEVSESNCLLRDTMLRIEVDSFRSSMIASLTQQQARTDEMLKELLKRIPAKCSDSTMEYSYASAKTVANIRQIKGENRTGFALALELTVYRNDLAELEIPVDQRVRSYDRVLFIQECVFKYYDVPDRLQVDVWKTIKEALNSRVRRRRKALRDGRPVLNPGGSHVDELLYDMIPFD